tara:strand:+ start:591 stop:884 length:294 start_codon:yes stop_codon:yes gene_type:complete
MLKLYLPESNKTYFAFYIFDNDWFVIDHYKDRRFPLWGWFKPCHYCGQISGHYLVYTQKNGNRFCIDLCRRCQIYMKKNKMKLKEYWNTYLRTKISF